MNEIFHGVLTCIAGDGTLCTYTGGGAADGAGRWNAPPGESRTYRGCGRCVWGRDHSGAFTRNARSTNRVGCKGRHHARTDDDTVTGTPSGYMVDPPLMHRLRGRAVKTVRSKRSAATSSGIRFRLTRAATLAEPRHSSPLFFLPQAGRAAWGRAFLSSQ